MNDALNHPGQLPVVPPASQPTSPSAPPSLSPAQQALMILMDKALSPHDMTVRFGHLKEDHIAKVYGITIE